MKIICNPETLAEVVARYGGVTSGKHHVEDGKCDILEAVSVCEGRAWTDDPGVLDRPDVRALNDAPWSTDEQRTEQMLRLAPLLAAWPGWDERRRIEFARRVSMRTVREVLPFALRAVGLEGHALACERATDLAAADAAARDALVAARDARASWDVVEATWAVGAAKAAVEAGEDVASSVDWAARIAARAAARIAASVAKAARATVLAAAEAADAVKSAPEADRILTLTVTIWSEEAQP